MEKQGNFWLGVVLGFIVMVVLFFLPVINHLIGGFVAGIVAKGGTWNGAKAGFVAGIFGALVIGILVVIGGTIFLGLLGFLGGLGIAALLVILGIYSGILGMIGGVIGGAVAQ
jgi:hypothetical protein